MPPFCTQFRKYHMLYCNYSLLILLINDVYSLTQLCIVVYMDDRRILIFKEQMLATVC